MPLTRAELRAISAARLEDAEALFEASRYDGCVYLTGYVLELALKARITKHLRLAEYPEESYFKVHDLPRLRRLAGIEEAVNADPLLFANWSVLSDWNPSMRYAVPGSHSRTGARQRLDALIERPLGVLTWLKRRW